MMKDGCFDVRKASKLDSEGRIRELRPYELLKDIAGVAAGMVCIDFGSGTGTFALPLASCVGNEGKVYAVDNSIEMLQHIQAKNPPPNLLLVQRDVEQTGLNSQIADLCLLSFILHEVKHPELLMAEAFRVLKQGGRVIVVEWKAELDSPGPPQSVRFARKQIEQLFNVATPLCVIDKDYNMERVNDSFCSYFEMERDDIVGKKCYNIWQGPKCGKDDCSLREIMSGSRNVEYEIDKVLLSGRIISCIVNSKPYQNEAGEIIGTVENFTDITERKQADMLLLESKQRYETMFKGIIDGIAVYEAVDDGNDFVFKDFNPSAEKIENIKKKDLIGKSVLEVFPGVTEFGLFDVFKKVWKTGKPTYHPVTMYKDERISGWRENYVFKLPSGEIVASYRDITERRQAKEKLQQARLELEHTSRLITAGEMTSGLAHELNQPLCAISNYSQACSRMLNNEGQVNFEKVNEALEQITTQANRAGEIIRRLRNLVRRRETGFSTVNINDVVREVLDLMASEAKQEGVVVESLLADDLPQIHVDVIQIEQVILNLFRNALDAMKEIPVDRRKLTIETSMAGDDLIEVSVRDTGRGLPSEIAGKIFDSFFTTKPEGLGMGLSLGRSIMEAHGGRLWFEPDHEEETLFKFTLPLKRS